jgi:RimJ/RimL family protein N-acetyltransferase
VTHLPADDGSEVTIRPIRPDDMERLQAFHLRLSPEAIRLRFHGYLRELPETLARRFTQVDGHDRVAFVAVTDDPERIVGVGRYDWQGNGVAEVAFVVEDGYQRRGIGSRLQTTLLTSARARGDIHTLLARVVHGNSRMRKLLEATGYPVRLERGHDADLLWLTLPEQS